ncbi:MAG: transporter substrate-binding domain-containing protein [Candidatus Adiutrix sp.]|jgi:L-cystine transport system substrate-binding protein|nr:transporter substrate-binding domain-containing protein [Candidatus Adiutrix sp.]
MKKPILTLLASSLLFVLTAGPAAGKNTYVVGTSGSFAPFCYTDPNGNLTGYDVEVLRAVDEKLDDISFEFKTFDFDGLFLGLDGGSIDFITHQLGKNAERESKYLYANEPLGFTSMSLATRADDAGLNSVKDLEGKSILITATGLPNTWLTKYNAETAKTPVILEYYEGDWVQGMQLVISGRSQATVAPAVNIDTAIRDMGLAVRRAPEPLYTVDVFFIFAKANTGLRDRIDAVLRELKADGTLSAISRRFLGDDYTGSLK